MVRFRQEAQNTLCMESKIRIIVGKSARDIFNKMIELELEKDNIIQILKDGINWYVFYQK